MFYRYTAHFTPQDTPSGPHRGFQIKEALKTDGFIAWAGWDSHEYGVYVTSLVPVTAGFPSQRMEGYFHLQLDTGGGYGVPVCDSRGSEVGLSYCSYPRVPGLRTLVNKDWWVAGPQDSEPFRGPATVEEVRRVVRTGDPSPRECDTPAGFFRFGPDRFRIMRAAFKLPD